ncbi:hypothetical protein GCM10010358_42640 [Streptomyces minutiscleroticus]|uniref:Uncharacterized protein n=1 Tax=Streptomyces minutiscleroticus TaxID=68238 RepID=A0A918NNS0_9ACTN|nr:hypothetical protein GCM10010358_42640 [Streptomyces minutiscleroticus]
MRAGCGGVHQECGGTAHATRLCGTAGRRGGERKRGLPARVAEDVLTAPGEGGGRYGWVDGRVRRTGVSSPSGQAHPPATAASPADRADRADRSAAGRGGGLRCLAVRLRRHRALPMPPGPSPPALRTSAPTPGRLGAAAPDGDGPRTAVRALPAQVARRSGESRVLCCLLARTR